jgi:hypothetical protein
VLLKLWSSFYRNQSLWTRRPRKKLIAGNCFTGGGTVETHQAVSRIHYGMDTRIGYPNEHLAGDSDEEFSSPLYATVGLVMNGIENKTQSAVKMDEIFAKSSCISPCCRKSG